jgi:acyl-CoA thioester hydrolase
VTHPELAAFPIVVEQDVVWGDMDSYAHVNNVVYFRYFESARIAYFERIGWMKSKDELGLGPIAASTQARFRKPLSYPDHIWIGARLQEMKEDRLTIEHKIVSAKWNAVATEGNVVVVSFDYRSGSKVPIPDAIRAAILELESTKQ